MAMSEPERTAVRIRDWFHHNSGADNTAALHTVDIDDLQHGLCNALDDLEDQDSNLAAVLSYGPFDKTLDDFLQMRKPEVAGLDVRGIYAITEKNEVVRLMVEMRREHEWVKNEVSRPIIHTQAMKPQLQSGERTYLIAMVRPRE